MQAYTHDFPLSLYGAESLAPLFPQEGVSYFDMTTKRGERWSTSEAYLHPVLKSRPNLSVSTKALVTRILFDKNRAVGVEYVKDGQRWQVSAGE